MKIHRFSSDESIESVAALYGISVESLKLYNGLCEKPCIGEELAILTPTRTYKAHKNDTLERISLRFAVKKSKLVSINPGLWEGELPVGREIALHFDECAYGTALANGYFYPDCTIKRLKATLPYLTYITFCIAESGDDGIKFSRYEREALEIALSEGKIPILRIYENDKERKYEKPDAFISECIDAATKNGFKGICLNLENEVRREGGCEFLIKMRKQLIGRDLILITEVGEATEPEISDYSDGSVICYPKYAMECQKSFEDGERAFYSDFAMRGDSAKSFIDLSTFALSGGKFYDIESVIQRARRERGKIVYDDERRLASVSLSDGTYTYPPLSSIKAILDAVYEYGYMGISFDIMKIPENYLYTYASMFSTVAYSGIIEHGSCREA
jgi:hypothetical protein